MPCRISGYAHWVRTATAATTRVILTINIRVKINMFTSINHILTIPPDVILGLFERLLH